MALNSKQLRELRAIIQPMIEQELGDIAGTVEEAVRKATSAPSTDSYLGRILGSGNRVARRGKELPEAARTFARLGIIAATAKGDRSTELDLARTLDIEAQYKSALSAGSAEDSGLLIAGDQATEVIELLRPISVMRQIGAREIDIPSGAMKTPKISTGVTSGYVSENQAIPASQLKTGAVMLIAHKLATLVVMSNELTKFGAGGRLPINIDEIVLDDMLNSISETSDTKMLFGSGGESEPLGLTNQIAAAHKFNANATVNVANVVADLGKAITLLRSANIKFRRPAWIFSGRTEVFLQTLLNADGQFVFRQEVEQGRLLRWPFFATENVPNDLGGGNDESLAILCDASEIMLGDVAQIAVDNSHQATINLDGSPVNLFETDRRALRVRTWNDIAMRHDTGAVVIEAVKWGA
jgi:HK97 family phage major capsid protein